jgi:hypothetical protein
MAVGRPATTRSQTQERLGGWQEAADLRQPDILQHCLPKNGSRAACNNKSGNKDTRDEDGKTQVQAGQVACSTVCQRVAIRRPAIAKGHKYKRDEGRPEASTV